MAGAGAAPCGIRDSRDAPVRAKRAMAAIRRYRVVMLQMKKAISLGAACAAVALFMPLGAQALSLGPLNQSVLLHIPARDVPDFRAFIGKALNEGQAGVPLEWNSSARSSKQPVKVQLTPGATVATQSAGQCRLLSANVSQRQQTESWNVWFCLQADGAWKISGLE